MVNYLRSKGFTKNIVSLILYCTLLVAPCVSAEPASNPGLPAPVVGAIRWDAWFEGNPFQDNLAPERWRFRLPFYAAVTRDGKVAVSADTQQVMDREIALARDAGLGYWAFCYYGEKPGTPMDRFNYGLRRYLASADRGEFNFCLILQPEHLRSKQEWGQVMQELVGYFKHPNYQKVLDGRPLVYIFDGNKLPAWAGSEEAVKAAFDQLDQAAAKAGLQEPYVVAQATSVRSGARLVNLFGLDAISSYTLPEKGDDGEHPYLDLALANAKYWDECRTSAKQMIPIVNVGWDDRPRRTTPEQSRKLQGPWYLAPRPGELAVHLYSALQWVRNNPEYTEANTIIIYAWNESDEGGWLVPTLSQGNARLEEVRSALERR